MNTKRAATHIHERSSLYTNLYFFEVYTGCYLQDSLLIYSGFRFTLPSPSLKYDL